MSQEACVLFVEDDWAVDAQDLRSGEAEALVRTSQAGAGHFHDGVDIVGHMLPGAPQQGHAEHQGLAGGKGAGRRLAALPGRRELQGDCLLYTSDAADE